LKDYSILKSEMVADFFFWYSTTPKLVQAGRNISP